MSEIVMKWRCFFEPSLFLLCCLFAFSSAATPQEESLQYCEYYTECVAVSRLEERLCLGNTRHRPYWLPTPHDPKGCHEKLKNDYRLASILEKIEETEIELERAYVACLIERTIPMDENELRSRRCDVSLLRDAPRFSLGRTITYVPTNCFHGFERRAQRQCGRLRGCCDAIERCSAMLQGAPEVHRIEELRARLYRRARDCERGILLPEIELPERLLSEDEESQSWSPSGNITLTIKNTETLAREKAARDAQHGDSGHIRINIYDEKEWNSKLKDAKAKVDPKAGTVSNSFQLRDGATKVIFPTRDGAQGNVSNSVILKTVDGVVALEVGSKDETSTRPQLRLPADEDDSRTPKPYQAPKNSEEYDAVFKNALKNTEEYKKKETKQRPSEQMISEAINSLMEAGEVSSQAISLGEHQQVEGSGAVEAADNANLAEHPVTSDPVVVVKSTLPPCKPAPRTRHSGTKMLKFDDVMKEFGEDSDSTEMQQLRSLLDGLDSGIRERLVEAKSQAQGDHEAQQVLDKLIFNFDEAQAELKKLRLASNSTFPADDYPEEDAIIAGSICEPLPAEDISMEEGEINGTSTQTLGSKDKFIVDDGNLALEEARENVNKEEEDIITNWHNADYEKDLEQWRQTHKVPASMPVRNETACDMFMRCRNQMHLALDGCAWRFAAVPVMPTLTESAESLLYRGGSVCDPADQPLYEDLYEMLIRRNSRQRECLEKINEKYFATSICLPFSVAEGRAYNAALMRILSAEHKSSQLCFHDANLIQEKCSKLRACCPNYDNCRDDTIEIDEEQAIISLTAQLNNRKQACLRRVARLQFEESLRSLLGRADSPGILGRLGDGHFLREAAALIEKEAARKR